ncbi:MAG: cell division protein CrgA [Actinomycetota bacterium]
MPPPKRTTSGRVTPKGTTPGSRPAPSPEHHPSASSRYTPPTPASTHESPRWVPILMAVLIGLGALTILLRYIVWTDSNLPVLIGLGFLLGGLYTATKWR